MSDDDVLRKADALMRRRSFVAVPNEPKAVTPEAAFPEAFLPGTSAAEAPPPIVEPSSPSAPTVPFSQQTDADTPLADFGAALAKNDARTADDDIPLLTEIVAPEDVPPPPLPGIDMAALREAIAAEMEAWLDRELPAQVQHVLDGLTDRLIIHLSAAARADLTPRVLEILSAAAPAKPGPTDD
jgi:hypothetical protein